MTGSFDAAARRSSASRLPTVTVIVATMDRPASLERALHSLAALQTGDGFRYEVVVVDNAAQPMADTRRIVDAVSAGGLMSIRYVHEARAGVAYARNRGVIAAAGEWIAFFDDDQIADPGWLSQLLAAARGRDAVCVGGAIHLQLPPGVAPPGGVARRLLGEQPFAGASVVCHGKELPSSGNLLVARRAFIDVGAFDGHMSAGGEDSEWVRRALRCGQRVALAPAAVVHHVVPCHRTELSYIGWVAGRSGAQFAYTDWKHDGMARLLVYCVCRLAQALLLMLPRLAIAWARGLRADSSDAALRLRRAAGYATQTWTLLRRRPGGTMFRGGFDMRAERRRVSAAPGQDRAGARGLRILAYHAIGDRPRTDPLGRYAVPLGAFQAQIEQLLAAGYTFIDADRLVGFIAGTCPLPRRAVLVTFDDAYASVADAAHWLSGRGIRGVVFAISGALSPRTPLVGTVEPVLDREGLLRLVEAGFEIGAHGHSHRPLRDVPAAERGDEIAGALARLGAAGLGPIRLFAYPFGVHDEAARDEVRRAGAVAAMTVDPGVVRQGGDPFRLRRIEILSRDAGMGFRMTVATGGGVARLRSVLRLRSRFRRLRERVPPPPSGQLPASRHRSVAR